MGVPKSFTIALMHDPSRRIAFDLAVSAILGTLASLCLLLFTIVDSEGSVPPGICEVIEGKGGLLPMGPYEVGEKVFSCDPDPVLFLIALCWVAVLAIGPIFMAIRIVRGLRAEK